MLSEEPEGEGRATPPPQHRHADHESDQLSPSLTCFGTTPDSSRAQHGPHRRRSKSASRHHSRTTESSRSHLLARMIAQDEEIREVNSYLAVANERLDTEATRANAAERRALDYFNKLKSAIESKDRTEQEAARLREELKLYKLQLENAQREIFRAQDIINQVSSQRNEAEAEAARARTKARKLQEEKLVMLAREEGRRQGYQEGLMRGRSLGYYEARALREPPEDVLPSRFRPSMLSHEVDEGGQESEREPDRADERPANIPQRERLRTTARTNYMRPGSAPPVRTYDTARHAPTLPVPTVATPIRVHSPSHESRSPSPPSEGDEPERILPIPVRPNTTVPPPDGWIPTADPRTEFIPVPPPHVLSSVPTSPSTTATDLQEDRERRRRPNVSEPPQAPNQYPPVWRRDYAYQPPMHPPIQRPRTPSIGSRASTHVSQYDLVSAPGRRAAEAPLRYEEYGRARSASQPATRPAFVRTDRHIHPSRENYVEQWRADPEVVSTATPSRAPSRSHNYPSNSQYLPYQSRPPPYPDMVGGRSHTPIPTESTAQVQPPPDERERTMSRDQLRQRFRQREPSKSSIPSIVVESPTETGSSASREGPVANSPHSPDRLSPESAHHALPREEQGVAGQEQQQQRHDVAHQRENKHREREREDLRHPRYDQSDQRYDSRRHDERIDAQRHQYRYYPHQPHYYPYSPALRAEPGSGNRVVVEMANTNQHPYQTE
ncbi:hypothetical protein EDC04DRAFT_168880 [Pisolithus marmoratus]|nr:hypothetical protein EDC04DRAFT_168880 [Pisolithus marmoratus]